MLLHLSMTWGCWRLEVSLRRIVFEVIWFDLLCLASLSAIFQQYHVDQF
jgi:hypothetical protein